MNEIVAVLRAATDTLARGGRAVLVTVVRTEGSTYRRPGARMVFPEDGHPAGFVSGGCLEADLAERVQGVFQSGEASTVTYDMRSPDDVVWGLGLGCNGEVRVLLERLDPPLVPEHLAFLDRAVHGTEPAVLATAFAVRGTANVSVGDRWMAAAAGSARGAAALGDLVAPAVGDAVAAGRSLVRSFPIAGGEVDVLLEHVAPIRSLIVFGAGRDAVPVCRFAKQLGWRVVVADHRPAYATPEKFPDADGVSVIETGRLGHAGLVVDRRAAVLVMTHHFLRDLEILQFALSSQASYVGILGPARRTELLLRELAARGVDVDEGTRARLHGPVGIDIGSDTPEEIALSALAEIQAVTTGRVAGFLRDREGPLHDGP